MVELNACMDVDPGLANKLDPDPHSFDADPNSEP